MINNRTLHDMGYAAYNTTIDGNWGEFDAYAVERMASTFEASNSPTGVLHLNMKTKKLRNMSKIFANSHFTELYLGENFDTSNVTNFYKAFSKMKDLRILDLSYIDFSSLIDPSYMFEMDMLYAPDKVYNTKLYILRLGPKFFKNPDITSFDFSNLSNWADLDSIRESLVENSYDRKSNGLPDCTIYIHRNTNEALVLGDFITTIESKGYIIRVI